MSDEPSNPAPLAPAYTDALRIHSLRLIALGYARMVPVNFAAEEEDAITGELTREMNEVLEADGAPRWMNNYSANEQVRANAPGKNGKERPIVDIEFVRHQRGRRPRLRFEAKRLGPRHTASGYFGDGGLEAFITGYYDRTHEDAGMLGYVQSENERTWSEKLAQELANRTSQLGTTKAWSDFASAEFPPFTYHTGHQDQSGQPVEVFHVLLAFG